MSNQKSKSRRHHPADAYKDRLIPFPSGASAATDPLWPVLSGHPENPFARFLRSVFFYPEESPQSVPAGRVVSGTPYFRRKATVH